MHHETIIVYLASECPHLRNMNAALLFEVHATEAFEWGISCYKSLQSCLAWSCCLFNAPFSQAQAYI